MRCIAGIFILLSLIPVSPTNAGAQDMTFVTTAIPGLIEPDGDGYKGMYANLFAEASKRSGIEHAFRLMPWIRAVGRVDRRTDEYIAPFTRTADREPNYQWVVPIGQLVNGFVTRDAPVDSLEAARKLETILVWRGSSQEAYLRSQGFGDTLLPVSDASTIAQLMRQGRAVAWFGVLEEANGFMSMIGAEITLSVGAPVQVTEIWIATNLDTDTAKVRPFLDAVELLFEEGFVDADEAPE